LVLLYPNLSTYKSAKWPFLMLSGGLVAPQQNGMLDFRLGSVSAAPIIEPRGS